VSISECVDSVYSAAGLRVLVVAEDRDSAGGLCDLLKPQGCQIAVANHVEQARQCLVDFNAHVALVDISLRGRSGLDLIGQLTQIPESFRSFVRSYITKQIRWSLAFAAGLVTTTETGIFAFATLELVLEDIFTNEHYSMPCRVVEALQTYLARIRS